MVYEIPTKERIVNVSVMKQVNLALDEVIQRVAVQPKLL